MGLDPASLNHQPTVPVTLPISELWDKLKCPLVHLHEVKVNWVFTLDKSDAWKVQNILKAYEGTVVVFVAGERNFKVQNTLQKTTTVQMLRQATLQSWEYNRMLWETTAALSLFPNELGE